MSCSSVEENKSGLPSKGAREIKTHTLGYGRLKVKSHLPTKAPPLYPDKILIHGLNPATTKEEVINYLEAMSREEVIDVVFGQAEGTVLVTFKELKDFSKVEASCQRKPLENHYIKIKRVPPSNCIYVSGFSKDTSESTIENYFDNERKSGGKNVTDVKFNHKENSYLVYFKDYKVCDKVCRRPHVVDNQNVKVQLFNECIGLPFDTKEGPRFQNLNPIVLRDLDLRKMVFVHKSLDFRSSLEKLCRIEFGEVQWPEVPATNLTVRCTLTKDVKDSNNLVNTWGQKMENCIRRIIDELQVEEINVSQEIWERVLEAINKMIVPDPSRAHIIIEKHRYNIVIVGKKTIVESLKKSLQHIISAVQDEIKKHVSETILLKQHQFMLLHFEHIKEEIEKEIPEIEIITNEKDKTFTFEGKSVDVMKAKVFLLERCHQICEASAGKFSNFRQDFFGKDKVKTKLFEMLKEANIISWFSLSGDEVYFYAFSEDNATDAAHLVKHNIVEYPIEVQPDSAYLLTSGIWEKEVQTLESKEEFDGQLQIITLCDKRKIIILTLSHLVDLARKNVENFLREKAIKSESVNINPNVLKFFELHHSNIFEEICNQMKEKQVQIDIGQNHLTVKGTPTGLNQALNVIDGLIKKIFWKRHTMQKPGIAKHINNEKGASYISEIQRNHTCCIQIGEKCQTNLSILSTSDFGFCEVMHGDKDVRKETNSATLGDRTYTPVAVDKNSVIIMAFGDSDKNVNAGIQSLEKLLEKDFLRKDLKEDVIQKLTQSQIETLLDLSKKFDVEVEIEKDKSRITIYGSIDEIDAASDYLHIFFREAELQMRNQRQAKIMSDFVQWYYINPVGQHKSSEYAEIINLVIERAFRHQEKEVRFSGQDKKQYLINFHSMVEYSGENRKEIATVFRRVKHQEFPLIPPKEWSTMKKNDNLSVVQVCSGTLEYSSIIEMFKESMKNSEIVKLERIQNKMLFQQYLAKKKMLDSQNPPGTKNERKLWHGTGPEVINSINSFGFNRSYCGRNATPFGDGVYFAVDAVYASRGFCSRPDVQGHKRTYLCNVLTGEYTTGKQGMRVPPTKPGQQSHILFDSVVNIINNPYSFAIFNDTQAYPAYLITFK